MAKCTRCGNPVGLLPKVCDSCKQLIAAEQNQRQKEELARQAVEQEVAERVQKERLEKSVSEMRSIIRKRLDSGQKIFFYQSIYTPVDSVLLEESLATGFDVSFLRSLGLSGWELIHAVPKTIGVGLQNYSEGSVSLKSWGGGVGGNIMGVHLILKKELTLGSFDNDPENEIGKYIETHMLELSLVSSAI
ncbi:MAG: hypothetical protein HY961_01800 [Ignavibacteriae bacterium]|nr:hypothetical protein [Ignavibacteriota bacterium]